MPDILVIKTNWWSLKCIVSNCNGSKTCYHHQPPSPKSVQRADKSKSVVSGFVCTAAVSAQVLLLSEEFHKDNSSSAKASARETKSPDEAASSPPPPPPPHLTFLFAYVFSSCRAHSLPACCQTINLPLPVLLHQIHSDSVDDQPW